MKQWRVFQVMSCYGFQMRTHTSSRFEDINQAHILLFNIYEGKKRCSTLNCQAQYEVREVEQ